MEATQEATEMVEEVVKGKYFLQPGFTIRTERDIYTYTDRTYYYLRGEEGAVQLIRQDTRGIDLGYHSSRPTYPDQPSYNCTLLGKDCYYDGGTLAAESVVQDWIAEGCDDSFIKTYLMDYYKHIFYDRRSATVEEE